VNRPAKLTVFNTLAYIYKENGVKGLYRGVTPRIGLGIWQTVCMVSFADVVSTDQRVQQMLGANTVSTADPRSCSFPPQVKEWLAASKLV